MTNREIAQEISNRIGTAPVPFDSVYSIALEIYHQLGGEESQFDSVYSILLEILPLVEGGSGKAIEEVDELPDAEENKDKFVRLKSNSKVYTSVLISSELTNRLPDEQQIDKAYVFEDTESIYYYKGDWKFIFPNGEVEGYGWLHTSEDDWYFYLTQDNAVNVSNTSKTFYVDSEFADDIDFENHTITIDDDANAYKWEYAAELNQGYACYVVPATYNAPEAKQIGNARCQSAEPAENGDYIYTGDEVCLIDEENDITLYGYSWAWPQHPDYLVVTLKKASEMYEDDVVYIPDAILVTDEWSFDDLEIPTYIFPYSGDESIWDYISSLGTLFNDGEVHIEALNAPDSEQISNASISVVVPHLIDGSATYSGEEVTIEYQSEEISGYEWPSDDEDGFFLTTEKAEDIYSKTDCDIYMVQGGNVTKIESMLLNYLTLTTEKKVRVNEIWDWKKLAIDNTEVISIDDTTSDDEWAKLNKFTQTGIYNNVKLSVVYSDYTGPAELIVQNIENGNIMQYIKFYTCFDYNYGEYVWLRNYDKDTQVWYNNIEHNPKTLHNID